MIATSHYHQAGVCNSFLPGHRLHWTQWKHASAAAPLQVLQVVDHEDGVFEIITPGLPSLFWQHHNPSQLRAALAVAELPIVASPQWRMLRIDGIWFNCVPAETELTLCV